MPPEIQLVSMLALLGALWWASATATGRSLKIAWVLGTVLPLALIPYWLVDPSNDASSFAWCKVALIHAGVALLTWARHRARRGFPPTRIVKRLIVAVLAANILFIAIWDLASGVYLNAGVAALLVLTLPSANAMRISKRAPQQMHWPLTWSWIAAYTLWDWSFVHRVIPEDSGFHIALLLAPILACGKDSTRWLQHRAYSLGLFATMIFTFIETRQVLHTPLPVVDDAATLTLEVLAALLLGVEMLRSRGWFPAKAWTLRHP